MSSTERPAVALPERNHAQAAIGRAYATALVANEIAERYGLEEAAEHVRWALDFLAVAATEAVKGE